MTLDTPILTGQGRTGTRERDARDAIIFHFWVCPPALGELSQPVEDKTAAIAFVI